MKIFFSFFSLLLALSLTGQSFSDLSYDINTDPVPNPERGFYHQVGTFDVGKLQNFKAQGVRLILKNYSLEGFNNKALSPSFINNLQEDFEKVREAGFKIIPRFAYKFSVTTPYGDAPLDIVLLHIEQMKSVLQANSDIILTFQAGFIGTWGEWYYTDHFSQSPGVISDQNWEDRRTVVNALMDIMPKDRMIQIRTPTFKKNLAELTDWDPITVDEAFNGSMKSRLAFHNDCFVASNTDYGTYNNIATEKAYLEHDSKYMIVGGETCNPSAQSNCVTSIEELERFHWSFLNLDYHQGVLNQWKDEGCWDEVANKLGFRFELPSAHLQKEAKPNGHLDFSIKIKNTGWANPSNPYTIQLILRDIATEEVYAYEVNEDIRKWTLGAEHTLDIKAGLPSDIPLGDYALSLLIKDGRQSLSFNPSYRIQTATNGTWNADLGENNLNHILTVSNQASFPTYTGSNYFLKEGIPTVGFFGPKEMKVTESNDQAIIYWTREKQSENELVRLQKSTDNVNFQTISINKIDDISFVDKSLNQDTKYYYRVQYILDNKYSEISSIEYTAPTVFDEDFANINIDNNAEDWDRVRPVATGYNNGMIALRFLNTNSYLNFMIEAPTIDEYEVSLNTTGEIEYKILNGDLYQFKSNNWTKIKSVETQKSTGFLEGRVALEDIDFKENTALSGQFFVNATEIWGNEEHYHFTKYPVIVAPESFKVVPSVVTPFSKVKVSWKFNSDASGYMVERSVGDDQHFELIKKLPSSTNYYLDKNLDSSLVYFYRMYSFQDIVRSEYTNNIQIHLGTYTATYETDQPIEYVHVFPNPMKEFSTIELSTKENVFCEIDLYDMNMKNIFSIYKGEIWNKKKFNFKRKSLQSGLYFIKIQTKYSSQVKKLVIIN